MSFAACKTMHCPTGIENCAAGFITHSAADNTTPQILHTADVDSSDWPAAANNKPIGPIPNLVVSAGNVLEVYLIRVNSSKEVKRGGLMAGVSSASLELVCHYRLHGNIYSMGVLTAGGVDGGKRRDSIILTFEDAKMSVLEFDDATHGLRTSSMHCFEGPDWFHLKRGRESFDKGPIIKVDAQGRCAGVFAFEQQMIILKAAEVNSSLVGEDSAFNAGGASARIESSYIITLRDLDVRHVKDFIFLHGYIEPVMVILHERELTWAGRVSWKHNTCTVSAFSISTTLKQHPLIWSAVNLPHEAYKLLAVPSPIGGVLVIGANTIHYQSQSSSCSLALNNFAFFGDSSQEMPRSSFNVELDAANATWLTSDVAMLSTKTGELLLLTIIYDGRIVQKLDLSKSRASVLTSGITTIGDSLFFLGSRLGDSLLVQFTCGLGGSNLPPGMQEEVGDIESDAPSAKRLRMSSSDALQDMINGEELSLYGTAPNNAQSAQKTFSFAVRDSLINVGPLKDFSYGMRINADLNATGIAKQSNYELVCCSGHGKNGSLSVLQQSIRPEMITQEALPGCKGIWTVYHKNTRTHLNESSRVADEEDEYHAYLIISLETRTMVLQTANNLEEVTENVDYYVQGTTLAAGNLFGRRRVIQVFAHGARILDGAFMTQELSFKASNVESGSSSDSPIVTSVSIADPYVLLRMTNGSLQLLVGDPSSCSLSITVPSIFESSQKSISACTLYHDKGPEPWLRKTSTDAWLSSGMGEAIDGADGVTHDQGDVYCVVCYENGTLEIFDVPNFSCVFSVDKFISGRTYLVDTFIQDSVNGLDAHSKNSEDVVGPGQKENRKDVKINVVELMMHRWIGKHSRPFLFGILADGTILSYHAYVFEGSENSSKVEGSVSSQNSVSLSNTNASRLRNLRFFRVPVDNYAREEMPSGTPLQRMNVYKNIGGSQGIFLTGSRPSWFMVFRERLRIHPQLCDGPIVAFTVLHNVNCNHGLIYVTAQGTLKICQLPSFLSYDNYWPVQKIPLKGTPHQVTYFAEKNFYSVIVSVPVLKPLNQVLSTIADQEVGHQFDPENLNYEGNYPIEEFEVRIVEPEKSGGPWQTRASIPIQSSENALTVRMVTLLNTTTRENETLLAVGTAYVQGEDVAARGRVLLFSIDRTADNSRTLVSEVYSKELKGAISALASLQGHLLIASGPKIILHKWTGSELNGVAFCDVPPLHVVSLNIVKNFILLGDIHNSIYFISWKEPQLNLLAKDFGLLDCLATEFLIDGSTLSLLVSDDQKNVQSVDTITWQPNIETHNNMDEPSFGTMISNESWELTPRLQELAHEIFYYAPKMSESWKGQKLMSRAEFHVGSRITKFLRLQLLPTISERTSTTPGSDKTNRFASVFGTLDGSLGCIAPLDELTFRRLQSLQKKLVSAVTHVAGLNPRSFRQFRSNGKAHRPGPDNIVDCELLSQL
ncbi:cleavage and polyadenylation specificity factor subunit 1 isoform X2 [Lycium barbarum]|uniref:cleavage and polyadenylation specificity factor subunit 1 isoform X2 n=1 Tax=Lycium barbarum TaxID=112863 RepID=UPI00293F5D7A|nr:cleavage and polyadenylation specificity factor subunit 1 isoform X2 [Lycium barbarum]